MNSVMPHLRFPSFKRLRFKRPETRRPDLGRPLRAVRLPRIRIVVKVTLWLIAIVAFAVGMLQTSMFRVDRVDVAGGSHLSQEEILSIARVRAGGSIATVNTEKAEKRLEAHPWVLHARVDAKWPHVVAVKIVEQRAVAIAPTSDKKVALLAPDGTVLSVSDKPVPNLPAVLGVNAPSTVGGKVDASGDPLLQAATLMPQSLQPQVTQMQFQSGVLKLGLQAGAVVVLGDTVDLGDKLLSAASVLSHTDPKTLITLDVTSPRFPVAEPKVDSAKSSPSTTKTSTDNSTTKPSAKSTQAEKKTTTPTTVKQ